MTLNLELGGWDLQSDGMSAESLVVMQRAISGKSYVDVITVLIECELKFRELAGAIVVIL